MMFLVYFAEESCLCSAPVELLGSEDFLLGSTYSYVGLLHECRPQ